jgi:glyoxalase family protein
MMQPYSVLLSKRYFCIMESQILGIHHITAIAGDAQLNYDFYTGVLGLRLVKKTVNFDDPGTYHFYYGNETGTPGTILTFFPWERVKKGLNGNGMATQIGYAVPSGSFEFWMSHFDRHKVKYDQPSTIFGEPVIPFSDVDGLQLKLIVPSSEDARKPWTSGSINNDNAMRGFHSITLTVADAAATAAVLTDIFGYRLLSKEGNVYRYITDAIAEASIVDIIEEPGGKPGIVAGGTNHHVAFRVKDEETLMQFREKVIAHGHHITPKIDRNYFFSLYFREPGGVLFEIATDNPGFNVDEPVEELGTHLKLPPQYEPQRSRIENILPVLNQ